MRHLKRNHYDMLSSMSLIKAAVSPVTISIIAKYSHSSRCTWYHRVIRVEERLMPLSRSLLVAFWVLLLGAGASGQVSFRGQKDFQTPFFNCCALVAGDFNGDGHVDLVASPVYSSTPSVAPLLYLQNNGDGTFTATKIDYSLTASIAVVAAADVNGDGKLDLVARDLTTGHGAWLAGHGDGTFDPPVDLGIDKIVAVADFRGDKIPDLLVDRASFDLVVRAGDGKGPFASPLGPSGDAFFPHISLGDLNGDGILDVLMRTPVHDLNTQLYIGLGQKDGTFAKTLLDSTNYDGGTIADIDGDGKADIVQTVNDWFLTGAHGLAVRQGNGDGTFKDPVVSPSDAGNPYTLLYFDQGVGPYTTADFDGDGKTDVISGLARVMGRVLSGPQPPAFAVSLGNGDLTFRSPITFGRVSLLHPPRLDPSNPVVVADFNGDGKPDVAFPSGDSRLSVMLNDSAGRSQPAFVSAADGTPILAPGSIGAIFGSALASETAVNTDSTPPKTLGGVTVHVHDGDGFTNDAQLLYVSPGQINFVMPAGPPGSRTAPGYATITVDNGSGAAEEAQSFLVEPVAPTFFRADGSGSGVPLASVIRVHPDGSQTGTPAFTCSGGHCEPAPIDLSGPDPSFLVLYGTGLRGTQFLAALGKYNAYCTFTGQTGFNVQPTYVGPQGQYSGLDQLNIPLPSRLSGAGDTAVTCSFSPGPLEASGVSYSSQATSLPLRFR